MLARKIVPFGVGFTMALSIFVSFAVLSQSHLINPTATSQTAAIPLRIEVSVPDGNNGVITTQQSMMLDLQSGRVQPIVETASAARHLEVAPSNEQPNRLDSIQEAPTSVNNHAQNGGRSSQEIVTLSHTQPAIDHHTEPIQTEPAIDVNEIRVDEAQQRGEQGDVAVQSEQSTAPLQAPFEPIEATIKLSANLRAGPSLDHEILALGDAGDQTHLFGRNEDASWYQIDNGWWIAGFLLVDPPLNVPVISSEVAGMLQNEQPSRTEAEVVEIVDGHTIEVHIGNHHETVRYIGVDIPDAGQPGHNDATRTNYALLTGQIVYLVADGENKDSEGRLLRHVYRLDGTHVNGEMIARGWG